MQLSTEDLVIKAKCMGSLLFHTRFFFYARMNRKFNVLYHHIRIAEALERVLRGECTRLIITVPPRYGKTEEAVKSFVTHGLSLNPAAKFLHLTASDSLSHDNSEGMQDIMRTPEYKRLFPHVQIKQGTDSKKKWYTTSGGGVMATGAAGQVTGFGAGLTEDADAEKEFTEFLEQLESANQSTHLDRKWNFGGAIVIDDAIKPDDTDSEVKRVRVNNRWTTTIKSRLNSRNTPVIVIMQRLHPDDLVGYLQRTEPGEWEHVNLPALYTNEAGELCCLDPSKHTVADLLAMQSHEDAEVRLQFERQYQQNPKPREGLAFPLDELHTYNPATVDVNKLVEYKFGYIDPADEGGDDLAAVKGYLVGNKIYIVDVIFNKKGTDHNEPRLLEFLTHDSTAAAQFEGNSAWRLLAKNLRNALESKGSDCEVRIINNTTNKNARIMAQSAWVRQHCIFRGDWQQLPEYRRFMQNLTDYREIQSGTNKNLHDDAPDSMAGLAKFFRTTFPDLWRVTL